MNEESIDNIHNIKEDSFNESEEFSLIDKVHHIIKNDIDVNCGEINEEKDVKLFSFSYEKRKYICSFENDNKNYIEIICLLRYVVHNKIINEKYISSVLKEVNKINREIKITKCMYIGSEDDKLLFSFSCEQIIFSQYELERIIIYALNCLDISVDILVKGVKAIGKKEGDEE